MVHQQIIGGEVVKRSEFLDKLAKYAVADYKRSKVLPSLTIAQGILESGWGQSGLSKETNNLFGIKGKFQGQGKMYPTREVYNGKSVMVDAEFRAYPTFEGSIKDHNDLLQKPRYKKVIATTDYKVACQEVQKAGYATDPLYADLLIRIIESQNLQRYDKEVLPKKEVDYMISKKHADEIIKILQEKWVEYNVRGIDDKKDEIALLANEIRKASGQKI